MRRLVTILWLLSGSIAVSHAETPSFVAPPRTITDLAAILDNERPDLAKIAATHALADDEAPVHLTEKELARFYFTRSIARWDLGRPKDAISDCEQAIRLAREASLDPYEYQVLLIRLFSDSGAPHKMLPVLDEMVREGGSPLRVISTYRWLILCLERLGRIEEIEQYLKKLDVVMIEEKSRAEPTESLENWLREESRARAFDAQGEYAAAERSYTSAQSFVRRAIEVQAARSAAYNLRNSQENNADVLITHEARMKLLQGRLVEAESDMRRALLNRLRAVGKFSSTIPFFIVNLADVLMEERRIPEATKLIATAQEIRDALGMSHDADTYVQGLKQLAVALCLDQHWQEAAKVFGEIDMLTGNFTPEQREDRRLDPLRVIALYRSGDIAGGIAIAGQLLHRENTHLGEASFQSAVARGVLAEGYAYSGNREQALREFRTALPILQKSATPGDRGDDATPGAVRESDLREIFEAYLSLIMQPGSMDRDLALNESFEVTGFLRGSMVQRALAASSARLKANDPALAASIRAQQDLAKQISAEMGSLNNVLALPPNERDDKRVAHLERQVERLKNELAHGRKELMDKFPQYADLVEPKQPTIAEIRKSLRSDEAFVSFYFGRDNCFVWAIPKEGAVAFAQIKARTSDIESKVRKLREALEPQVAMISDIPPFDLKLGYELYSLLLQPVEAGWKQSKSLIVVTNGALGLLPLSLLPTAQAEIKTNDDPLFSSYRVVPWLARTHAVSLVPSPAALPMLRSLPPGEPGRSELIAFGDPLFSMKQATEAAEAASVQVADAGAATTRGLPLKRRSSPQLEGTDSAKLALLPRLPDTADELKSIAMALRTDPLKVLHLGKDANEQAVKTMDLSGFKVLAFATHGLVPGELDGLTQPALALSAPEVAGIEGDGLLTMEEILALKLDADWVVLSACNTAAGAGAGAEAASGLGLAFFYAGTRALLVTNWSVHSQSAKNLVTDLFKRQADDSKLTRAEALRRAMLALMDGPGYLNPDGATEFTYAHSLFWGPYSIIGDGGER